MQEQPVIISIQKLNHDGRGEGPFNDKNGIEYQAEVPFTVPGDKVEALVKRKRGGVYPGRLLQVVEPAKGAVSARCVHFGKCGGCLFQRLSYEEQLAWKEQKVRSLFPNVQSGPIIGCTPPWAYRNKMEFTFSQDAKGEKFLGMMLAGSRGRVFELTECHLVSPWFASTLAEVRRWWNASSISAYFPPRNSGSLRTLTLRESATTGARLAMLTVSGNPEDALHRSDLDKFKALFDEETSLFLRIHQAIRGKPTQFYEMHLQGPESIDENLVIRLDAERQSEVRFSISPSAFFQPNTKQAERLYSEALKMACLKSDALVYDLYCGTGTLGCLASRFVKKVLGIELSAESSLDARENAKANGLDNIEVITGDVGKELALRTERPSVVLLDPPRSGLDPNAIHQVASLKPERIVYISCNPVTQARDVALFQERGFVLEAIQPVDQFAQTPHIENIALLTYPGK